MNGNAHAEHASADLSAYRKQSQFKEVWRRLKKNRVAMAGLAVITFIFLCALFADVICDYKTMAIDQHISQRLQTPSREHWFGTDSVGRDLFARIIHGARVSIGISFATTLISAAIGLMLGACAGYFGGLVDGVIMRCLDCIMSIPAILLSLAIVAALGQGIDKLIIAITVAYVPGFARIVRSVVLKAVGNEYIEAARAGGAGNLRIIFRYVLPNSMGPIIVQIAMSVAGTIQQVAALSFIGLGIVPPTPEWGGMLSESKEFMRYSPYLIVFPGLAIILTSLSLNLLGDGLRDALDPRLKD